MLNYFIGKDIINDVPSPSPVSTLFHLHALLQYHKLNNKLRTFRFLRFNFYISSMCLYNIISQR
jgi:hypothetical protein